jgi:hypothetical protein
MDEDIRTHLSAVEEWLASYRNSLCLVSGLTGEERKQLQSIEKSIRHLSASGVSIPDELRQLKLQLSAKDVGSSKAKGTGECIAEVGEIVGYLARLTQVAKVLHNSLKSPNKTSYSKQRYEVTLKELIQNEYLSSEDKLELCWKKDGPIFEGKVDANGTLLVRTPQGWKAFDSLSSAATAIAKCSLNGWLHWRRIHADGTQTTLNDVRAMYLNKGGSQ